MDGYSQKLLRDWFVELETPPGFRAELIEGELLLNPLPIGKHEHCISGTLSQIYRNSRADMMFSGSKGLTLGNADGLPQDHVIPDGTFVTRADRLFRGAPPWMPCEGVHMVMEVTGFRPSADREIKRRCYARGGIPLYLLIDRETRQSTLFRDPQNDDYRDHDTRPFGTPLPLPTPFEFELDTSDFL
ncbi:Uma2 family endonuclease [Streptomyces sp. B93]|uniref:Uma2 family endonuclease n=1 Tax=Streptomyces sp. B93 TaxID=2824875 RepID=UPI001B36479D|nr:Uma2 family endonuclease [Streptomyces sp. B93]MBQ1093740.1 Uma2 family endonuclease [Streptomyces sp. B93]